MRTSLSLAAAQRGCLRSLAHHPDDQRIKSGAKKQTDPQGAEIMRTTLTAITVAWPFAAVRPAAAFSLGTSLKRHRTCRTTSPRNYGRTKDAMSSTPFGFPSGLIAPPLIRDRTNAKSNTSWPRTGLAGTRLALSTVSDQEERTTETRPSSERPSGDNSLPGVQGFTENWALTYLHSGSNCLDLFFDSVPGMERERLAELLENAWTEDPLTTLKIIFQLGDPRGGKGDRKNFYTAMLWLYENHSDTLMLNLQHVPKFSYYKALLDILQLACHGPTSLDDKREFRDWWETSETRQTTNQKHMEQFFQSLPAELAVKWNLENSKVTLPSEEGYEEEPQRTRWVDDTLRSLFVDFVHDLNKAESEKARHIRKARQASLKLHADTKRKTDARYLGLYSAVADIFAQELVKEDKRLKEGATSLSGLVAKWAPTPKRSHDRHTNIVDGIIERLYPESTHRLPDATYAEYISFMRDRYRKEYLSAQRKEAEVPEHFIGGAQWDLVNYKRMASRCRQMHGHIYEKHDGERYRKYIEDAKKDVLEGRKQKKLSAGALLPHEVTTRATMAPSNSTEADEANLQWLRIVEDTRKAGCLPSALAICDVSASMSGRPMDVAVALSLLLSDIAEEPWKHKIITFSQKPEFVNVPKATIDNLSERVKQVKGMNWGFNTDFQAVFVMLLEHAKFLNVPPEGMPQVLFCFSDMEFDEAHADFGEKKWATDLEQIQQLYTVAGYPVPQIIFWNLRPSRSRPSSKSELGVAMLSGFSAGMMKSFLKFQLENFTPLAQMLETLKPYDCLRVAESDQASETTNQNP